MEITQEKDITLWRVEYNNDVGPDDDRFWEWWEVTDGNIIIAKCDELNHATLIANLLNKEGV